MDKKELSKIANEIKPEFNIGKQGLSESFCESVDKYLEAHLIVKIKATIATNKDELKDLAEKLRLKTDSEITAIKGFTFVLYRE